MGARGNSHGTESINLFKTGGRAFILRASSPIDRIKYRHRPSEKALYLEKIQVAENLEHNSASMLSNPAPPLNDQHQMPLFPSGLSKGSLLIHVATHPQVQGWLQLVMLGCAAGLVRYLSKFLLIWAQYFFCVTSTHSISDDSYGWLIGEDSRQEKQHEPFAYMALSF